MLAARCEENAVALIKCITSQVNKGDADDFVSTLHCISECKKEQSNLHRELARVLGSLCKIQSLDLNYERLNAAALAVLAKAIKTNSTLTARSFGSPFFLAFIALFCHLAFANKDHKLPKIITKRFRENQLLPSCYEGKILIQPGQLIRVSLSKYGFGNQE